MQLNRYPRITTSTMIIFLFLFSFNHHRATFYSTTLAPVWSSANRVWFCREWRAARRDATHVTLATPKAKDPAHLSTCTLHVSLAFSMATSSSSSIYTSLRNNQLRKKEKQKVFLPLGNDTGSTHVESGRFSRQLLRTHTAEIPFHLFFIFSVEEKQTGSTLALCGGRFDCPQVFRDASVNFSKFFLRQNLFSLF